MKTIKGLLVIILLGMATPAYAEIYHYVDSYGRNVYTSTQPVEVDPCPQLKETKIHTFKDGRGHTVVNKINYYSDGSKKLVESTHYPGNANQQKQSNPWRFRSR
jgi:hypothetical protein